MNAQVVNILLIGPRGCGKSTIARLVADRLGWRCFDLDDVITQRHNMSVSEFWRRRGELAWREAEREALDRALTGERQVIALGGGAPMHPPSRSLLAEVRAGGDQRRDQPIVYLQCDPDTLRQRLTNDPGDRPPLTGSNANPAGEIEVVLALREPAYLELADVVIDAGAGSPLQVAQRLIDRLGLAGMGTRDTR